MAGGGALTGLLPSADAWIPVGKPRLELRWFTAGDLPARLRPVAASVQRVDAYHVPSLTTSVAIKRRGNRNRLEGKWRSRVEPMSFDGVEAVAERWCKLRARPGLDDELAGPWLPVAKQIWSVGGIEIARVAVDGHTSWTLALALGPHPRRDPRATRWVHHLGPASRPASYAAWLLEHLER